MDAKDMQADPRAFAVACGIDPDRIPTHVACIMDGNGRWANKRGLERSEGHLAGEDVLYAVVEASIKLGVRWLSAYAFSTENWTRPNAEVEFLMNNSEEVLKRRAIELNEQGVRIHFTGRRSAPLPDSMLAAMQDAEELTAGNDRLHLVIAFNYGGRAEIVDAVKSLARSGLNMSTIDESSLGDALYVENMPDVDLMIRTSNEFRISNFLLWEIAYAELYFTETLWPDFGEEGFVEAVRAFQQRSRRFGGAGNAGDAFGGGDAAGDDGDADVSSKN